MNPLLMMENAMTDYDYSRERLVTDMKTVLADTEELLRAVGAESKEKIAGIRPRVEAAILRARTRLAEMEAAIETRARQRAREVDAYAAEHPWKAAGMAAAVGAAVGAIVAALLARR